MKNISKGKKAFIIIGIILAVILLILDAVLILYPQEIKVWIWDIKREGTDFFRFPGLFKYYAPHNYFKIDHEWNALPSTIYTIEAILKETTLYDVTYCEYIRSDYSSICAEYVFEDEAGQRVGLISGRNGYYSIHERQLYRYGLEYEKSRSYLLFAEGKYFYSGNRSKDVIFAPLDGEYPYIEIYMVSETNGTKVVETSSSRYDATYFGAETKYVTKDEFVSLVREYQDKLIEEEREKNKGEHLGPMQCG